MTSSVAETNTVTYEDIEQAAERIKGHIPLAKLLDMPELAKIIGAEKVIFVLDTPHPLNMEGAENAGNTFKLRGAANAIFQQLQKRNDTHAHHPITFVTASAGNHAQGVAAAIRRAADKHALHAGDRAIIFVPTTAPKAKIENTKTLGRKFVEVRQEGETFDDTKRTAQEYVARHENVCYIPPFDDKQIIAGQGTLGREIFQEYRPDLLYAPCGGGGLVAGLQIAKQKLSPASKIIAAEPLYAPSAMQALSESKDRFSPPMTYKGRPVAGGVNVGQLGALPTKIMREGQTGIAEVTGEMIEHGTLLAMDLLEPRAKGHHQHKYSAELAAGAAVAALLNTPRKTLQGKSVAVIISGANPEWEKHKLRAQVEENYRVDKEDLQPWNEKTLQQKVKSFPAMRSLSGWINMEAVQKPFSPLR